MTEEKPTDQLAKLIAEELGETEERPIQQIRRMIEVLGELYVHELLDWTRQREAEGGMRTLDGSRRRTPGGVFFWLTRQRMVEEGRQQELRIIFPPEPFITPQPPLIEKVRRRKRINLLPRVRRPVVVDQQEILRRLYRGGINQAGIQATIERYIGTPSDLRKCSINPTTGAVTLMFNFPVVAEQEYGDRIRAAAEENNLSITIDPQVNHQAVREAARELLPSSVQMEKLSLLGDGQTVRIRGQGYMTGEDMATVQEAFRARTGLHLELILPALGLSGEGGSVNQQQAMDAVRTHLGLECLKVSADPATHSLTVRFAFPDVAQPRYAKVLEELSEQTGWAIMVSPAVHQGELERVVRAELEKYSISAVRLSVHQDDRVVGVRHQQEITLDVQERAVATVAEQTGWQLVFRQM